MDFSSWDLSPPRIIHSCAKSLQSCPALYDLMDCSPPGSSVHRTLQARTREQAAMPFSRDLPDPGIEPGSLSLLRWAGRLFTSSTTWDPFSDQLKPTSTSVRAASPNSLSEAHHFPSEPSPFFLRVKALLLGGPLSLSLLVSRNQIKEGKNEAGRKEMVWVGRKTRNGKGVCRKSDGLWAILFPGSNTIKSQSQMRQRLQTPRASWFAFPAWARCALPSSSLLFSNSMGSQGLSSGQWRGASSSSGP